ncbi:Hsp20/alpha crystallin family protein [Shewanella salipaludis]|uniref:Hsp20/alpha crystallin family protein n=1 Tax=Shewanella salipaludis TaxID=2723052 RepID=A0A972G2T8_9GAMM|nr:Hsp20/alpha crystallin family protein [Shewanella salipaludis]NMH66466.1 Hsp20/alpha crystallin family protein [Shewanella salipaludis]
MKKKPEGNQGGSDSLGGILQGLGGLVEKLGELAEKGEQLKRSGEFNVDGKGEHKDLKGVYGFSVKVGLGEEGERQVDVQPFGNVRRDKETGISVVEAVREPLVDIFDEADHVLVVAEMPGICEQDLKLELSDDILELTAEKGNNKYHKEILLPGEFTAECMTTSMKNGVMEIRLQK